MSLRQEPEALLTTKKQVNSGDTSLPWRMDVSIANGDESSLYFGG